jgi:hypothetical protein
VAPTDTDALRFAASLTLPDFEDALQVAAAHACGARWDPLESTCRHASLSIL